MDTSGSGVRRLAAPLERVCLAEAENDGLVESQRAIATLHSFRFFGLVFLLPGVIGPNLPASFPQFAAYGDLAPGLLAILALLTVRMRPVFSLFVIAFNVVGAADILIDYFHGNQVGLAAIAGQLGATYWIPILYVPLLMITHIAAFYLLLRPQPQMARILNGNEATA